MALPAIALWFGGEDGWRYAIGLSGLICLLYSGVFYFSVRNTPKGSTYFRPKQVGAMEVTSKGDLALLLVMKTPMYLALALLAWKLSPGGVAMLSQAAVNGIYLGLGLLYVYDAYSVLRVNRGLFSAPVAEIHRYQFKQVAVLNVLYFATFGSELAVVSMLPLYFLETFEGLSAVKAGLLASGFAFMNLVSRPMGGWFSDKFGRRKSMLILIGGLAAGYFLMGLMDSHWWIPLAVLATMACSFFVQAGEGAVFAIVPLIKRSMTGQIAGMAGAYGNVGAVVYLTVLSYVSYSMFFYVIAASALVGLVAVMFLDDPKGHITEVGEDGTVHRINVG